MGGKGSGVGGGLVPGNGEKYNVRGIIKVNRFGRSHRPSKYESVEEMEHWIEKYFEMVDELGMKLTFTGLRNWVIGNDDIPRFFETYGPEYEQAYKLAESAVEEQYESITTDGATAGAIYILNNRRKKDWSNKQEYDFTSGGKPMEPAVFKGVGAKDSDDDSD